MNTVRHALAAATLAVMAVTSVAPGTALAQTERAASASALPKVTAFDVRQVDRVEPGAELDFTLWGTPGVITTLQIDGALRPIQLGEVSPGRYQGTYTVGRRDRITPDSKVIVNLRRDNRVTTAMLSEPLQEGWPSPVAASSLPKIESLRVTEEPGGRRHRDTLRITMTGTPGGYASVQIDGTQAHTVVLDEVRSGEYTGTYTLAPGERLQADQPLTGRLRVAGRSTQASVSDAYDGLRWNQRKVSACADCGVVQAINRVEVDGDGRVLGTVAGGVIGGLVGSQIGKGDGRTAASVVGAVGGALLGREIERRHNRRTQYEVVVRASDGQIRTVMVDEQPTVKVGDSVRVVGDTVELRRG